MKAKDCQIRHSCVICSALSGPGSHLAEDLCKAGAPAALVAHTQIHVQQSPALSQLQVWRHLRTCMRGVYV